MDLGWPQAATAPLRTLCTDTTLWNSQTAKPASKNLSWLSSFMAIFLGNAHTMQRSLSHHSIYSWRKLAWTFTAVGLCCSSLSVPSPSVSASKERRKLSGVLSQSTSVWSEQLQWETQEVLIGLINRVILIVVIPEQ